ncbi:unnamed protein product [Linum trigynum]|uniref:Uncharacterized protein n=1 Tax=Linum trigynum TaxID=586398 RepID=A0AAV2CJI0_9ROSI
MEEAGQWRSVTDAAVVGRQAIVDQHADSSPEGFGFGSSSAELDPNPGYSEGPFGSIHAENDNDNGYDDADLHFRWSRAASAE